LLDAVIQNPGAVYHHVKMFSGSTWGKSSRSWLKPSNRLLGDRISWFTCSPLKSPQGLDTGWY